MQLLPLRAAVRPVLFTVALADGSTVGFRVYWLARAAGWYMDMLTTEGTPVSTGRRITPGAVMAFPGAGVGVPPGQFVAMGPDRYGREDLGRTVTVGYLTADEVAALADPTEA